MEKIKAFFKAIKDEFNKLPDTVQVMIYSGISTFLSVVIAFIDGTEIFNWRRLAVIPIGIIINIVLFLKLRKSGGQG